MSSHLQGGNGVQAAVLLSPALLPPPSRTSSAPSACSWVSWSYSDWMNVIKHKDPRLFGAAALPLTLKHI